MKRPSPETKSSVPFVALLAGVLLVSVSAGSVKGAISAAPQDDTSEAPGPAVQHSESCALCHESSTNATAMRDRSGASVAPYDLWRSTMMANSSRDPLWRAAVDAEIAAAPAAAGAIAAKCLKCHAPMAERIGLDDHGTNDPLHVLSCESELGLLAQDGVSCTICHGMSPDGLGTDASFTAGFALDPWRRLFGPHEEPFTGPMLMHTGLEPAHGSHIENSKLCGSCHTLITHPLDAKGAAVTVEGEEHPGFHEQTPYLEWRNSAFSNETADGEEILPAPTGSRTCQSCHVPRTGADGRPIRTNLAHNPGGRDFPFLDARTPFGRHLFVGGNTLVLGLLRDNAEELGVTAPTEAFDATIEATRDQLEHRTASLALSELRNVDGRTEFDVTVTNLSGHKLPSGHPSRRMWLEVTVKDADGNEVFVSGRSDAEGRLVDAAGEPLASEFAGGPIQPHRNRITEATEVLCYRAVMADSEGKPTHRLMRGASWYLDNRLFPRGWSQEHPDAERTAAFGIEGDADYLANSASGSDRVTYSVPASGELEIEVRLCYQSVSPRWVAEIATFDTPAIQRFLDMYGKADRTPVVLATTDT
ncbi:hypothetical protein Poly30_07090 [Planctomycetes bacterium Poly30]|uniref:Uncharacterized protein n=1 Tax=Saltatorellus ferox TaxID=2528018 RepID=A0A518EMA7_9BACT|nr:hypothetical protein Poly30_07090 [Planctomycetes bacterium Poly30]